MIELKLVNPLQEIGQAAAWRLLVSAAKQAAKEHGLLLSRRPGRGLANVWESTIGGETVLISIRTTRDRYIAFPPLQNGRRWKTLDEVQKVLVATVDDPAKPVAVEVYLFEAADVRARFDAAYSARVAAGQVVTDNFGMWLGLDRDMRDSPAAVGTGIVEAYKQLARFRIADLIKASPAPAAAGLAFDAGKRSAPGRGAVDAQSVGEIIAWARERIAQAASVPVEAVKLDLRIEHF